MYQLTHEHLPGVHAAPNIQTNPDVYELENQAADPNGLIEAAMEQIAPWAGKVVLDLGAGTGFHIPRFATKAQHVIAVEPDDALRRRAMGRVVSLSLERVSIVTGSAEQLFLRDASVDVCHARFAYFFAPNCLPGLQELARVMRQGGTAFVIDNDLEHGTFTAWLRQYGRWQNPAQPDVERFWQAQGFALTRVASEWRFNTRADLEAVVRLEFGDSAAEQILANHQGTRIDYHYCIYYRRY